MPTTYILGSPCHYDIADYDLIHDVIWYRNGRYFHSKYGQMHRVVLRQHINIRGFLVDHINGNGLDNRKENLRICLPHENAWNMRQQSRNTSGKIGVSRVVNSEKHPHRKQWMARIFVLGKFIHLGSYHTKEEAIEARIAAEKQYFGKFSPNT